MRYDSYHLTLFTINRMASNANIKLHVQLMSGDVIPIRIRISNTVADLKQKLHLALPEYDISQLTIASMNSFIELDDETPLSTYGLRNQSVVFLIIKDSIQAFLNSLPPTNEVPTKYNAIPLTREKLDEMRHTHEGAIFYIQMDTTYIDFFAHMLDDHTLRLELIHIPTELIYTRGIYTIPLDRVYEWINSGRIFYLKDYALEADYNQNEASVTTQLIIKNNQDRVISRNRIRGGNARTTKKRGTKKH